VSGIPSILQPSGISSVRIPHSKGNAAVDFNEAPGVSDSGINLVENGLNSFQENVEITRGMAALRLPLTSD
jgi:hypothetical protein